MQGKPRILFVSDRIPGNLGRGDSQRVTLIYRALERFADVDMFLLTHPRILNAGNAPWLIEEYRVVECVALPNRGEWDAWASIRRLSPKIIDRLASALGDPSAAMRPSPILAAAVNRRLSEGNYDLVVSRYLQVTAAAGLLNHRPLMIDLDDLDTIAARTRAEAPGVKFFRKMILKHKLKAAERAIAPLWGSWSCAWVCSTDDAAIVRAGVASRSKEAESQGIGEVTGEVAVLPNIPQWPATTVPPPPGNQILITVASLSSMANCTGIDRFIRQVWPAIRKACPAATYRIIGRGSLEKYARRWKKVDGVVVAGYVEDLTIEYAACDFTIAPIFFGAGTKIKVLEAAAYGRTCVTTSHAQRGYTEHLHDRDEIVVCDDPILTATACIDLLRQTSMAADMGRKALTAVEKDYSFERFCGIVRESINQVLLSSR